MTKVQIAKVVSSLELQGVTLGIYTNNLACYEALKNQIPPTLLNGLISYSTVNRAVQKAGDFLEIPTTLGIFIISKKPVLRFFVPKQQKEIGVGQNALQGCNVDSNPN